MATMPPTIEERLARLEGVYEHLASKADLAELRSVLKDDMARLQAEITRVESGLKNDIAHVESGLKDDMARLQAEITRVESGLKDDMARLQAEMAELKGSVKILVVVMTSGLALLNIVLRFWPS